MDAGLVNDYKQINWDRILRRQLGEAGTLEAAKPYFERVRNFLDKLLDERVIDTLSPNAISDIEANIRNFIYFINNEILSYSDVSQRDQKITTIKNQTGSLLENLFKYQTYFDVLPTSQIANAPIEKELQELKNQRQKEISEVKHLKDTLRKDSPGLEQAISIANQLVERRDTIDNAIRKVEEFIKVNEKAVETLLQKNATSFSQKAQEHLSCYVEMVSIKFLRKINFLKLNQIRQPAWYLGVSWWLLSAILSGIVVLGIISYFIFSNHDLSLGTALLRLSALIVPSYFSILFVNQFLSHRKLYEQYRFKDIALQTMVLLRKEFINDPNSKNELLNRSMTVIFSEPTVKEDSKYDKQMIMEILKMLGEK